MSLQKRLVAVVALLLVVGLVVADVVTYASVRSFLYGRADSTLAQDEGLAFNYLEFASVHGLPLSVTAMSRRVSTDVYVIVKNRQGQIVVQRPSGSPTRPDPAPMLTNSIPVQQVPDIYRLHNAVHAGRYAGTFRPDADAVVLGATGDPDGQYRTIAVDRAAGDADHVAVVESDQRHAEFSAQGRVPREPGGAPGHGRPRPDSSCGADCDRCARWRGRPMPSLRGT